MLNVTLIRGDNQYAAAHYFSSADDYYVKENPGLWQGAGAERLGLVGAVEQKQLSRLLDGQLPNGERIHTTFDPVDNKKRMGLDLTFSAPKSVSMQALIAGDTQVTDAHDRAVASALAYAEKLASARKKVNGKSVREDTGNLVIGRFRHEMSRAKDPQLHTHAVVLNMTQRSDGAWRALSNELLFAHRFEIEAHYHAELAINLKELGYKINRDDHTGRFELAHITREQIEAFSERSRIIEEALANDGKTRATATTLEKQIISLATRKGKDERDREIIKEYWVTKSRELGIDFGARSLLDGRAYGSEDELLSKLPPGVSVAQVCVQYAVKHLGEREAVATDRELTTVAMQRAVGLARPSEIRSEIKRLVSTGALIPSNATYTMVSDRDSPALTASAWALFLQDLKGWTSSQAKEYVQLAIERRSLVAAGTRHTTTKALKLERAILAIERDGRGQVAPIIAAEVLEAALAQTTLNAGQRQAVGLMLGTTDRFVGIQGDAGVGKSYAVSQAVKLIKKSGVDLRTVALAPYGDQVDALKKDGLDARTLESFLRAKHKPVDEKTLVILDEAGLVGARQMARLMRIVEKANGRLVLLGDTKQMEPIEFGKPLAQLQQEGMKTARISQILRQLNKKLKKAVQFAADGNVRESLDHVCHVEELPEAAGRHQTMASEFVALSAAERDCTLMVAGTNKARREINRMVRDGLDLLGKGRECDTLIRVDMTNAQRGWAANYKRGMVIQPEQSYVRAGLNFNERYVVKEVTGIELTLQRPDGTTMQLNPNKTAKISVYEPERAELAVGDVVRINRQDKKLGLNNGDRMRVKSLAGGVIKLESIQRKKTDPVKSVELSSSKPLHLEHAYATTVHSAQGLTTERTLMSIDTKSRTTSMNLYYVALSRAEHEARLYTDCRERLAEAITRRFDKTTALELLRERSVQRPPTAHELARLDTLRLARAPQSRLDGKKYSAF